jgi:undecaprenyl pyrophosphate phosphatase UppP
MTVAFMAFVLGLVQALTEFMPVSSSAHLILARTWMNSIADGLTFDVALHLGPDCCRCLAGVTSALARGFKSIVAARPYESHGLVRDCRGAFRHGGWNLFMRAD